MPKIELFVASFSSNVHRIQQVIDGAVKYKRKLRLLVEDMINVVGIASELDYLKNT